MEQGLEDGNPDNIELLTWAEIHERTRAYYGQYHAVLEGDADDSCFDRKQRELARTRDVLPGALTDLQRCGRKDLAHMRTRIANHRYAALVSGTDRILRPISSSGGAARSAARTRAARRAKPGARAGSARAGRGWPGHVLLIFVPAIS
jgi:hypothetical protein